MSGTPFAQGRCQCGAVSFSVAAPPVTMGQCHCKDCQRASGTGHMSNARFRRLDVTISGETKTFAVKADSGNVNTRHFCPTCGSRLFGENSGRPGFMNVAVGAFDDHTWFDPQWVLYKNSQPLWDITAEDVPCYDGMPPPT
ncbi:GFA family protein [Hyphomicrobium sp.]|uniref:GFA family protein n=1 Tax=Hyphomicrobium sp. TaxID=82 RepID=UPI0025BF1A6A|nr:GFA family protein [Hyphomicrobium sp.]